MRNNIYIFSRPIQSGKTTLLAKWVSNCPDAAGILTPDIDGKRCLLDIATTTMHPLEVPATHPNHISVGRFRFNNEVFQTAQSILRQSVPLQPSWLIIDEIGKLEIERNTGLEPAVSEIISAYQAGVVNGNLLLVVRDYLLSRAITHYQIQNSITWSSRDNLPRS